ncbi:MAG TPA: HAD-IB family hydrolase [Chitinophagaceae bacterium]|nr:HAD-IB family hydrolase [Chitinophagaceae bacterium]
MKKRIAFFDFDGTITTKDSFLEIIKYCKGSARFYMGFILNAPFIIAWKAGLISNQAAKERMMQYFFGRMTQERFNEMSNQFSATALPSLVRPKALLEIKKLLAAGTEVVIVSASAENWLQHWCQTNGVQLLGTKLAVKEGRITGKIENRNCHGQEKVARIRQAYDLSAYDEILGYGDTKGDKPMLELATFSFYKPFR